MGGAKKYIYPGTNWRRLRGHPAHGFSKSTAVYCIDRFVPWMKVRIAGSGLVRCAYRFGTMLTSLEVNWSAAQKTINRRPYTMDKFWVQSLDPHSCVGF